jgi:NAD-dependent DNA ligase
MYLKDLKTLPAIFDDDDYEHTVKEWLLLNIIPEDYMNIHVVQLDDSGEQNSVMKMDDLGDERIVCRDYRPMNYSSPSEVLRVQEKMDMIKDANPLALEGMYFVLTGQPKYMIRAQITTLIRAYKGNVRTTVSGKTQFLVKGLDAGDSKERKAKELNVYITDEDGLFLLIAGGRAALKAMVAQEKAGSASNSNSMDV